MISAVYDIVNIWDTHVGKGVLQRPGTRSPAWMEVQAEVLQGAAGVRFEDRFKL